MITHLSHLATALESNARLYFVWIESTTKRFNDLPDNTQTLCLCFALVWLSLFGFIVKNRREKYLHTAFAAPTILYSRQRSNTASSFDAPLFLQQNSQKGMKHYPFRSKNDLLTEPDDDEDHMLFASAQAPTKSTLDRIQLYGPMRLAFVYETWTPPPTWTETSRRIIPPDKHFHLVRYLAISWNTVTIHHGHRLGPNAADAIARDPSSNHKKDPPTELALGNISLHVQNPVEGGVVQFYSQDAPRDDWHEHTFPTAADAAQFQMDVLGLQVLGPTISNMFAALQIIHQGSMAHDGKEYICHDAGAQRYIEDRQKDYERLLAQSCFGCAWDDVMRCLGSVFPSIRLRLEAIWWKQATAHLTAEGEETNKSQSTTTNSNAPVDKSLFSIKPEYVKTRLLLGPLDFIRLFIPILPVTSLPRRSNSKQRVEQLLRWRKRVARAAVLVNAYTEARIVVNRGWQLNRPFPESYWKRRLASDDSSDNDRLDATSEHEYYEPTVSRDVICQVRGKNAARFLSDSKDWFAAFRTIEPSLSLTQGYSLVGIHSFHGPDEETITDHSLRPHEDPVLVIPSLRDLVESHPTLDFFVSCFYFENEGLWHYSVFVRSLSKGVDANFDNAMEHFYNGDKLVRDRKLEFVVRLGTPRDRMSWQCWLGLMLVSFLTRLAAPWYEYIPSQSLERSSIPALRLSRLGELRHFGGSLNATKGGLLKNYVSHVLTLNSNYLAGFALKALLIYAERTALSHDSVDVSFIVAGETEAELPERVVGTYRMVKARPKDIALPYNFLFSKQSNEPYESARKKRPVNHPSSATYLLKALVTDPFLAVNNVISKMLVSFEQPNENIPADDVDLFVDAREEIVASIVDSADPLERAVNELIEVLESVKVPVRRSQLGSAYVVREEDEPSSTHPSSLYHAVPSDSTKDLILTPITRLVSREDIRRFYIAQKCNLRRAAVKLVAAAGWHGVTYPIDTRYCRIELQNGQFFQQGRDKLGNPVFYFRNMLLGPWRKDENATMSAVLYRLEKSMTELRRDDAEFRCTLVVTMGKPRTPKKLESGRVKREERDLSEENASDFDGSGVHRQSDQNVSLNNPRIEEDEAWHVHTSKRMVYHLISLVMSNYPERLHRALVVIGHGNKSYTRTAVGAGLKLSKYVASARTRDKVKFLIRYSDLREFISPHELVTMVGGTAPVAGQAYDFA